VPIMEELKDLWNDKDSSAERFGDRFRIALTLGLASALFPSDMLKQPYTVTFEILR